MPENHLILCGDVRQDAASGQKVQRLRPGRGDGKIHLDSDSLSEKMVQDLPSVLHDLLEVATYVYVADQAISRGGQQSLDYGEKWHRSLTFRIPVREYDLWSASEIVELLQETLSFASGDTYLFEFQHMKDDRFPELINFRGSKAGDQEHREVLLFSGGLDSFTGAVDEMVKCGSHPVLVSHQSHNRMKALQRDLHEYLCGLVQHGLKPLHIPVMINKDKRLTRETSQRSRSFLYAALGTVVARVFGLDRIRFYENGVVSCNLPFDGQTLQARATRSTHPKLLRLLSALLTELLDKKFTIENPYFGRTRTEVCERLGELQHQSQIGQTRSCARCIYRHPANHCGTCSQCIDRRFATLAAKCGESDPDWLYALNIFTDALEKPEDRAMALGYIGFARSVENMTVNEFIKRFGSEAFEIGRHLGTDSTEVAVRSLFFLHERHAKGVNRVMVEKMAQNTSATYHGTLPETCLLSMVSAQKHIECRRRPAASTRRKHAREALDLRVARCLKGRTNPTAQQVADSIGNTTADAVRQTKAWKSRPGKRRK